MAQASSGQSKRSIVRLASILAFAGIVFGGGIAAGATGSAIVMGRTNDAGSSKTTLRSNTSTAALQVQQLGVGPALTLTAATPQTSALKIGRGAIEVDGAGVNTSTAAFRVPYTNTECGGQGQRVRIDNPLTNGHPELFLFLTPIQLTQDYVGPSLRYWRASDPSGDTCGGYWYIERAAGADYNVLVIKP